MRDIPLFTTRNGAASLLLKKIPFTKEAYVQIQDSLACNELVKECIDVCRMAGAEAVYAAGHSALAAMPLHCTVLQYGASKALLPKTDALALPVAPEQTEWWRQLYNQKMIHVPAAAPLSVGEAESLLKGGKAFCIYRECSLLGIGVAFGDRIEAIASVLPGAGRDVTLALANCLDCSEVSLSVASTNEKAISLYRSLGFTEYEVKDSWHKIF